MNILNTLCKANTVKLCNELAKSIHYAQPYNFSLIKRSNYNLNKLNADEKESHDTTLVLYNLDVTNKTVPEMEYYQ